MRWVSNVTRDSDHTPKLQGNKKTSKVTEKYGEVNQTQWHRFRHCHIMVMSETDIVCASQHVASLEGNEIKIEKCQPGMNAPNKTLHDD